MRPLRFVGLSEDGSHLVLAPDVPESIDNGERFTLPVDERLSAASRGDTSRLGQIEVEAESNLRPREIQARIRAGEAPEAVANAAGARLEKVMRYAYPVLQERAQIAERAQQARVKLDDTSQTPTLRELITSRLAVAGADAESVDWDARRVDDGVWEVSSSWRTPDKTVTATWRYDVTARTVTPNDRDTVELVEPPKPPRLATVNHRLADVRGPRPAPGDATDAGEPDRAGPDQAATQFTPDRFADQYPLDRYPLDQDVPVPHSPATSSGQDEYDPDPADHVARAPEVPPTGTEQYSSESRRTRRPRRSLRERFAEHAAGPTPVDQVPFPPRIREPEDPDAVGLDDLLEPDVPEFNGTSAAAGRRAATGTVDAAPEPGDAEPTEPTGPVASGGPLDATDQRTRPSVAAQRGGSSGGSAAGSPGGSQRRSASSDRRSNAEEPAPADQSAPAAPAEPAASTSAQPEQPEEPPARTKPGRDRKPRVPAWDDIVFGVKRRP